MSNGSKLKQSAPFIEYILYAFVIMKMNSSRQVAHGHWHSTLNCVWESLFWVSAIFRANVCTCLKLKERARKEIWAPHGIRRSWELKHNLSFSGQTRNKPTGSHPETSNTFRRPSNLNLSCKLMIFLHISGISDQMITTAGSVFYKYFAVHFELFICCKYPQTGHVTLMKTYSAFIC